MSNVSDREAQPRRQHQLADGRRSRGYIPVEDELLETPLSAGAFKLFVLLRHDSIQRETDGLINARALSAVAAFHGIKPALLHRLVEELQAAGVVEANELGVRDVNFACWCRLKTEREELRREWIDRQRMSRDPQLRRAIRERDGDTCQYCGTAVDWSDRRGPRGATYDHVDPDGPSTLENLVVACRDCNTRKGGKPLDAFLAQTGFRFRSSLVLSLNRGSSDGPKDVLSSRSRVKGQ